MTSIRIEGKIGRLPGRTGYCASIPIRLAKNKVAVGGIRQRRFITLPAILDTGFSGMLILPKSLEAEFSHSLYPRRDTISLRLGGATSITVRSYTVSIELLKTDHDGSEGKSLRRVCPDTCFLDHGLHENEYAVLGMQLLMDADFRLDGRTGAFSLQM